MWHTTQAHTCHGHLPTQLQACFLPLHARDGFGIAVTVAQSAYMALLLALARWRTSTYARHRSLLLSGTLVCQAAVSAGMRMCASLDSCRLRQQVGWQGRLCMPLLLASAVGVHCVAVALSNMHYPCAPA